MDRRPAVHAPGKSPEQTLDAGFWLVLVLAGACLLLALAVGLRNLAGGSGPGGSGASGQVSPSAGLSALPSAGPSLDPTTFLYPTVRDAPAIDLTDPEGRPLSLAAMRGGAVLVFFGYTHCPDVCPATIGTVEQAMGAYGAAIRTVFVTVDPERDTQAWLKEFDQYRSPLFTAVTGSEAQIRATADAWGVRYARVETGVPGAYSMSHTADVFLVDGAGELRAHFPFGTTAGGMVATLGLVAGSTATPGATGSVPTPAASASVAATGSLRIEVDSTSIWAGGPDPLILTLFGPAGELDDSTIRPSVQLISGDGVAVGDPVQAVPVRPPGLLAVSYVAQLAIPAPGPWRLAVSATPGALALTGTADITALDQGSSAAIGSAAPSIHTPTLTDTGGAIRQLSTDPIPDLRLYQTSASDLLAQHQAFVLVLDSARFRVTTACGKALIMARYLQDRWPNIPFVHVEPFGYDVVTDTPVLRGTLANPQLTDVADAWGIGGDPWGPTSMPWVFVVDSSGTVRAKYQGVMGSADIDVIVALLGQESPTGAGPSP